MSWIATYNNVVWTTAKSLEHHIPAHEPFCYSIEGYRPFSSLRVFDFSPCFEAVAVLPVPLVVLLVSGAVDLAYIRRKGPKKQREGGSARRMWAKTVSFGEGNRVSGLY